MLQGAPEGVLDRCTFVRVGTQKVPMTPALKAEIMKHVKYYGTGTYHEGFFTASSNSDSLILGHCASGRNSPDLDSNKMIVVCRTRHPALPRFGHHRQPTQEGGHGPGGQQQVHQVRDQLHVRGRRGYVGPAPHRGGGRHQGVQTRRNPRHRHHRRQQGQSSLNNVFEESHFSEK